MEAPTPKQKLYCYVDETGQHTDGALFFVAVVIVGSDRDALRRQLAEIEEASGKGIKKWVRSTRKQRVAYMRAVLNLSGLARRLYYSKYADSRAYVDLTILSTAKALNAYPDDEAHATSHLATIFVDGLHSRVEAHRFAKGLRQLRVRIRKVRGITDQSDHFLRLADALAGFVRDGLDGDQEQRISFSRAIAEGKIREV